MNHQTAAVLHIRKSWDVHMVSHVLKEIPSETCVFCRIEESISSVVDDFQRHELWRRWYEFGKELQK